MKVKELVKYCNHYKGTCEFCEHGETCDRYVEKYDEVPALEQFLRPRLYIKIRNEEI